MEKSPFEILMLAITGLDTKFTRKFEELDSKFGTKFDDVTTRLDRIDITLNKVAFQTSNTVDDVKALERRLEKLEGPSA
jgi:hypothetical protein